MKNHQKPSARRMTDGETLSIHSIFDTIQGEGPYVGNRATFVRLAGCNLQCPLCDTEYTDGATDIGILDLVERVLHVGNHLIVLTGGEPLRQNIGPFLYLLRMLAGDRTCVQVETNGKLPFIGLTAKHVQALMPWLRIVVSPKTAHIHPTVAELAMAYKYVIKADDVDPTDLLPIHALDNPLPADGRIARPPADYQGPIYINPVDEQDPEANMANMDAAVAAVMHGGRRILGVQLHKYARLP